VKCLHDKLTYQEDYDGIMKVALYDNKKYNNKYYIDTINELGLLATDSEPRVYYVIDVDRYYARRKYIKISVNKKDIIYTFEKYKPETWSVQEYDSCKNAFLFYMKQDGLLNIFQNGELDAIIKRSVIYEDRISKSTLAGTKIMFAIDKSDDKEECYVYICINFYLNNDKGVKVNTGRPTDKWDK
jgi:hypothetical protein